MWNLGWEKYLGWNAYQYCRNNPLSRLDPSGLAEYYIIDTEELLNDGDESTEGVVFVTDLETYNANTSIDESNGQIVVNWNGVKAMSTLIGDNESFEKIVRDIYSKILLINEFREDGAAIGLTADGRVVYSYGGQGVIGPYRTDVTAACWRALQDILRQGAVYHITIIHSHGYGLNPYPSNPKDYEVIEKWGVQAGMVLNDRRQAVFFDREIGIFKTVSFGNLKRIMRRSR